MAKKFVHKTSITIIFFLNPTYSDSNKYNREKITNLYAYANDRNKNRAQNIE